MSTPADAMDAEFAALAPGNAAATAPAAAAAPPNIDQEFANLASAAAPSAQSAPSKQLLGASGDLTNVVGRGLIKGVSSIPYGAADLGVGSRNLAERLAQTLGLADPIYSLNRKIEAVAPSSMQQLVGSVLPTGPGPAGGYQLPSATRDATLDAYTAPTSGWNKASEFLTSLGTGVLEPNPSALNAAAAAVPAGFKTATAAAKTASNLTGAQQQILNAGQNIGMRATPGQQIGSVPMQQLEAWMQSHPWTSGPFGSITGANSRALGTQAARAIGETGSSVDSSVLGRASDRLGDVFGDARSANRIIQADPAVTGGVIDNIDSNSTGLLPGNMSIRDNPLVAQLQSLTDSGAINGQQVGQLSSKLGKAAYKQMSSAAGDRDLGQALYQVKDHADDLLQSAMSPEDAAVYGAARGQYRTLLTLTKPGVVNSSTGVVNGQALANVLQKDTKGYVYGKNQSDLYNAARFSQAFKPTVGDSGTATRGWGLTDLPFAIPANIASRAYIRGAVPAVRAAAGVPQLAQPLAKTALYGGLLATQ